MVQTGMTNNKETLRQIYVVLLKISFPPCATKGILFVMCILDLVCFDDSLWRKHWLSTGSIHQKSWLCSQHLVQGRNLWPKQQSSHLELCQHMLYHRCHPSSAIIIPQQGYCVLYHLLQEQRLRYHSKQTNTHLSMINKV